MFFFFKKQYAFIYYFIGGKVAPPVLISDLDGIFWNLGGGGVQDQFPLFWKGLPFPIIVPWTCKKLPIIYNIIYPKWALRVYLFLRTREYL